MEAIQFSFNSFIHSNYGIVGQVINVPVDVDTMVKSLPRALDDDRAFNVNLKKNIIHKSSYLSGFVKKSTVHSTNVTTSPWIGLYSGTRF